MDSTFAQGVYYNGVVIPSSSSSNNDYADADPLTNFIHWIIVFIAIPSVSFLGIIGNSLSLTVLVKHGFRKSSNILLFILALSDITFIIGINGPPKVMYEWDRGGFYFPEHSARLLYYFYHFFDILNWGSGPSSLCIPVLITLERFVAVYFPLKFPVLVTPRRTFIACLVPFIFFYGLQVYVRTWFQFLYLFDESRNATQGLVVRSAFYWNQRGVSKFLEMCFNGMIVMVLFVGSGCVVIGVKIKLAAVRRFEMTNRPGPDQKAGVSKTTQTLLCLCVVYTLTCSFVVLPAAVPKLMVFPLFLDEPNFRSVSVFTYHIFKLVLCINASCNFAIYVATNTKFRATFVTLMCRKMR